MDNDDDYNYFVTIIIIIIAEFLSSTVFMNVCKFKAYQNSAEYLGWKF